MKVGICKTFQVDQRADISQIEVVLDAARAPAATPAVGLNDRVTYVPGLFRTSHRIELTASTANPSKTNPSPLQPRTSKPAAVAPDLAAVALVVDATLGAPSPRLLMSSMPIWMTISIPILLLPTDKWRVSTVLLLMGVMRWMRFL